MNTAAWTISVIAIGIVVVLAWQWGRAGRAQGRRSTMGGPEGVERPRARYEFMSPSWIAMARREITKALSARNLDVQPFTLSEEFTDPPEHLRREFDTIGFSVRVGEGRVEVGDQPDPDADCRIITDYADALSVARDPEVAAVDPAEAERRIAEGRLRIEGDPARIPAVLQEVDIHRLLVEHTA